MDKSNKTKPKAPVKTEVKSQNTGIGSNSEPQNIEPILPDVNDIAELGINEIVAKYAPTEAKALDDIKKESLALKNKYPNRVIDDAEGRELAHQLAKRANALKNAIDKLGNKFKSPHYDKYMQIHKAFKQGVDDSELMSKGWMGGVSEYDARQAAIAAKKKRDELQAIADAEAKQKALDLAESKRKDDEIEQLKRDLAKAKGVEEEPVKETKPAQTDMLGDQTPNPPVQEQSSTPASAPESAPVPASAPAKETPVEEVKAEPVADVPVELAANQERVWSVKTFDPTRVDLNKLGVGFFGKGQVLEALNRYAKANKEQAVIDGVEFTSEIKTKLGR